MAVGGWMDGWAIGTYNEYYMLCMGKWSSENALAICLIGIVYWPSVTGVDDWLWINSVWLLFIDAVFEESIIFDIFLNTF